MNVLGLMSGTSADGVDAVLAQFSGDPKKPQWKLLNFDSISYPLGLTNKVIDIGQGMKVTSKELLEVATEITDVHVQAAQACDPKGQSELVGCHGQTVWHQPPKEGRLGCSFQLIQAPLLACRLNLPVIHDFRSSDIAHGGQGAPLVPKPDGALLGRVAGWRALLNLGGIANLTLIPPSTGPERFATILGWDCGPANTLIDLAVKKLTNDRLSFDMNGAIAASGVADLAIISDWLKEPYFQKPPPKSSGREQFGKTDLEKRMNQINHLSMKDIVATITNFGPAIVQQDLTYLRLERKINPVELIVSGGGSRNSVIINELKRRCSGIIVRTIDEYGIPVKAREALAFALLAWWNRLKYPGNIPAVTGSMKEIVLGIAAYPF